MSTDRGMYKDVVHIFNGILLGHLKKGKEIMPFAATWMQTAILSEGRQKYRMTSLTCGS